MSSSPQSPPALQAQPQSHSPSQSHQHHQQQQGEAIDSFDVSRLFELPISVKRITISGNTRVSNELIQQQLQGITESRTFHELDANNNLALEHLRDLDLFKSCRIQYDKSAGIPSLTYRRRRGRGATEGDRDSIPIRATVTVQEKRPLTLQANAEQSISSGEQTGSLIGKYRNFLGYGEIMSASVSYGTQQSQGCSLAINRPITINTSNQSIFSAFKRSNLYARLFNDAISLAHVSSYYVRQRGLSFGIESNNSNPKFNTNGVHRIAYESAYRDIYPQQRTVKQEERDAGVYTGPSPTILQHALPSFKSSLKYTYTYSRLKDNKEFNTFSPTQGSYTSVSMEAAGTPLLGGDVHHIKSEIDSKYYYPINDIFSIGSTIHAGYLQPIRAAPTLVRYKRDTEQRASLSPAEPLHRTHLIDRFMLGGPLTLRGYEAAGVGPHDGIDAVGGDIYAATSFHISASLKRIGKWAEDWNLRGQAFINAGNLIPLPSNRQQITSSANDFLTNIRASVGVGIVAPSPIGRIELSVAKPLNAQSTDRPLPNGFAFGIGVRFL